ncbi:MAG: hypothetical protein WBM83_12140, partial [Flavobacteriaceae bacterium]
VVVTNSKNLFQSVKDSLGKNYALTPSKEKFLLRCVLKYNDAITRIQDIQGKLERKTLLYTQKEDIGNKDYKVQIDNMRKVGIVYDPNEAYFIFPSFYQIWSQFAGLNTTEDGYGAEKVSYLDDGLKMKLEFGSDPKKPIGYFIINAKNLAIEEFYSKTEARGEYLKSKSTKYRTILYQSHIFFNQDPKSGKYFIGSGKTNARVETTNESKSFVSFYDVELILTTSENFGDFAVKSNVNEQKDIFKIDYPYDETYWNSENQLLLTNEMLQFIEQMGTENKEFKVKSNLKN